MRGGRRPGAGRAKGEKKEVKYKWARSAERIKRWLFG